MARLDRWYARTASSSAHLGDVSRSSAPADALDVMAFAQGTGKVVLTPDEARPGMTHVPSGGDTAARFAAPR